MSPVTLRVRARGPMTSPSGVRHTVQSEFADATSTGSKLLSTAASSYVRRAFGTYEKAWIERPPQFGGGAIVRRNTLNPRAHAAVHETGRGLRKGGPGGVAAIKNWIDLRGIVPKRGNTEKHRLDMARAIAWRLFLHGWPNLGSFKGGYYPGQPPKPVERAMKTQAGAVANVFTQATRRISRRLGS